MDELEEVLRNMKLIMQHELSISEMRDRLTILAFSPLEFISYIAPALVTPVTQDLVREMLYVFANILHVWNPPNMITILTDDILPVSRIQDLLGKCKNSVRRSIVEFLSELYDGHDEDVVSVIFEILPIDRIEELIKEKENVELISRYCLKLSVNVPDDNVVDFAEMCLYMVSDVNVGVSRFGLQSLWNLLSEESDKVQEIVDMVTHDDHRELLEATAQSPDSLKKRALFRLFHKMACFECVMPMYVYQITYKYGLFCDDWCVLEVVLPALFHMIENRPRIEIEDDNIRDFIVDLIDLAHDSCHGFAEQTFFIVPRLCTMISLNYAQQLVDQFLIHWAMRVSQYENVVEDCDAMNNLFFIIKGTFDAARQENWLEHWLEAFVDADGPDAFEEIEQINEEVMTPDVTAWRDAIFELL